MQTFLPLPDFEASAACLDNRRLGKQRVEAMQILNVNANGATGWANHPATLMWRGYNQALASYGLWICQEWNRRNFNSTVDSFFENILANGPDWDDSMYPPWFGNAAFHSSHRAALLAKEPAHYRQFGWAEEPKIEYVWPKGAETNA